MMGNARLDGRCKQRGSGDEWLYRRVPTDGRSPFWLSRCFAAEAILDRCIGMSTAWSADAESTTLESRLDRVRVRSQE